MPVQQLFVEHAVLFHASVGVHGLFALAGHVPPAPHPLWLVISTCQISAGSPRCSDTFPLVELF